MQSCTYTWNLPHAVSLTQCSEFHSPGTISLRTATDCQRRRRFGLILACKGAEGSVLVRRFTKSNELCNKCPFIASSPSSYTSPTVMLSPILSGKHLRTSFGLVFLMKERKAYQDHGQYFRSFMIELLRENVTSIRSMIDAFQIKVLATAKEPSPCRLSQRKTKLLALVAAMICLTCPTFTMADDSSIVLSNDVALAQSVGQIRQAALFLERLGGSTPTKVLDKVMTVISGQTVVTPETVEQLKSMLEGEKDSKDWQTDFANGMDTLWSTTIDVVSQFNPISLIEAAGNGIQGLVEGAAERFAAFELSTLIALGERWVLWAPFVILPMYWQMTKNQKNEENVSGSRGYLQGLTVEVSDNAVLKAARVRDELERIEMKASLLDLVYSLGKAAWQANGNDPDIKRRQIDEILMRLQDLSPTSSTDVGGAAMKVPSSESRITQHLMDVDGEWNLIYVSQDSTQGEQVPFPQLLSLNIPGIELSNLQQKLWRKGSKGALVASESDTECLDATNTAHIRLGALGVVEVSVQGLWENKDAKTAALSFQSFSAKPVELLGSRVREDIPPVNIAIPSGLQASGEWKTVYLDNSLRINRRKTGQLFLFRKMG